MDRGGSGELLKALGMFWHKEEKNELNWIVSFNIWRAGMEGKSNETLLCGLKG